jgi:signal transduction histidine kinase/CheY-like chemotaxis protein/HAMP domain-containing protein
MKNLNIRTQLILVFAVMLVFIIVLALNSYFQVNQIHTQMDETYNHPMIVLQTTGTLGISLLTIQRNIKDMLITTDENEIAEDLHQVELMKINTLEEIDILYNHYLGPRDDIDKLKQAFIKWHSIHDETIRLIYAGKIREAADRTRSYGIGGRQAVVLLKALKKIDDFARNKFDTFYRTSLELCDSWKKQLLLLIVFIFLISIIVNYILIRNIRRPLKVITNAAKRFHDGDLNARSSYALQNEFGVLSASFNTMVENIQFKTDLDEKWAAITSLMVSEYDIKKFFQVTLNALAASTGSQMAAIYLLSDDKKHFNHFESIGVDDNARKSFSADHFDGEFGTSLFSRKVHHIKNIPEETRFVFQTVSGRFIPREIITIPVLADNEVIAVISLATVSAYSQQSILLIDRILVMLCARAERILAYHKIQKFSASLEHQNSELQAQKAELSSQSAQLTEQNTELEMQKNHLNEASRLKTNFLSNMSHELRTPLNSVIALAGVLNRRLAKMIPDEEFSFIEVIERNGKHLLNLINDILDISRIEAGHEDIQITEFNAGDLLAELVSMIEPLAKQKNIELLYIKEDTNLSLTSDANKCNHILQNIIGNAVKFTEEGKVEVTARQSGKNIVITVTDTGIGIEEDHLPHIFNEFRQADSSSSRKYGGTGLGLTIAKKYANLLGGTIAVTSVPGKGSEFTLTLPLVYAAENRIPETNASNGFRYTGQPSPKKAISGVSGKTILLVEDSEPAIIQVKDFLEESGYHILVARDGGEALGIIDQAIPDAMILDLMMPGIDGFQVLKTVREAKRTSHIPVLILTAKQITKEELRFLKQNNVHQLIQKGDVNRNELLNAVATMVFPETVETANPQRVLQSIKGKPEVLVVEDNPDNMITVKALLLDNFNVVEAVYGLKSIEMAKKHKPNLILMDIKLPVMDGIEAFKAIRNDSRLQHIPIIALTASTMIQDRETILAYGFDAYITKPIDEKIFYKIISEVLYGK